MIGQTGHTRLDDFIRWRHSVPWRWGVSDCLMTLADWVHRVRGVDPAAPWRGKYATEDGANAIVSAHGGLDKLVGAALAPLRVGKTGAPVAGDIAAVMMPMRGDACGVIAAGHGLYYVATVDRGVMLLRRPSTAIVAAWSLA